MTTAVAGSEHQLSSIIAFAVEMASIINEEERKLIEDFPKARIIQSRGRVPIEIVVVYDFLKLNQEERYRLFDFERRLMERLGRVVGEYLGRELPPEMPLPVEVRFVRKVNQEYGEQGVSQTQNR